MKNEIELFQRLNACMDMSVIEKCRATAEEIAILESCLRKLGWSIQAVKEINSLPDTGNKKAA